MPWPNGRVGKRDWKKRISGLERGAQGTSYNSNGFPLERSTLLVACYLDRALR